MTDTQDSAGLLPDNNPAATFKGHSKRLLYQQSLIEIPECVLLSLYFNV